MFMSVMNFFVLVTSAVALLQQVWTSQARDDDTGGVRHLCLLVQLKPPW